MTNAEIITNNVKLIKQCVMFQAFKSHQLLYINDIFQELCLILMEYPNDKLNTIVAENHLNAFITGILTRQLFSKTSAFYRKYRRFSKSSVPISDYQNTL